MSFAGSHIRVTQDTQWVVTVCMECSLSGKLGGASVPRILLRACHTGTLCPACINFQTPKRKVGVQPNHIIYTHSLGTVSHFDQLRGWEASKIWMPAKSQPWVRGPFCYQEIAVKPAMLFFFPVQWVILPMHIIGKQVGIKKYLFTKDIGSDRLRTIFLNKIVLHPQIPTQRTGQSCEITMFCYWLHGPQIKYQS